VGRLETSQRTSLTIRENPAQETYSHTFEPRLARTWEMIQKLGTQSIGANEIDDLQIARMSATGFNTTVSQIA
jgi:hypothetical protein